MSGPVVALSGGVGGAKLALGLSRILADGELLVIVNTADDFTHLGLAISPDLDTLVYTLAGMSDPDRGWGRRDETWAFMAALRQLGGETWFQLGDADLAMHVQRTRFLAAGGRLSEFTAAVCRRLGIATQIVPMTDAHVATRVRTDAGWLDFQEYFVRHRCAPVVRELAYSGADSAEPPLQVIETLRRQDLRAVVICPSNPFLSIDPILAIGAIRDALLASSAPVVAVSPLIGGRAVKGPTSKMMLELGLESSAAEIARHYADLIDMFIVDEADWPMEAPAGITALAASTLMTTIEDREHLARTVLDAADRFMAGATGLRQ